VAVRHLDWEGCFNVRDLGGLPAAGARVTRRGALVRSDALDRLSPEGWRALEAHGVRTVVDLRTDGENRNGSAARPRRIATVRVPLARIEDRAFRDRWGDRPVFSTPLVYEPFLDRFAGSAAAAVAAIARAEPGGVAFHCAGGRDRTGLIAGIVLTLVGVAPDDIVADYALSAPRMPARFAALGLPDPAPAIAAFLRAEGTTAEGALLAFLRAVDVPARMRAAGLTDGDLAALRDRSLEPAAG
jgi:protein-tyrosine phosphatase